MDHLLPTLACLFLLASCAEATQEDLSTGRTDRDDELAQRVAQITGIDVPTSEASTAYETMPSQARPTVDQGSGTRTHVVMSSQFGIPMARLDLPAHWNYRQDPRTGNWEAKAHELEVRNTGYQSFTYITGQMAQFYQASGVKMRAPLAPADAFQQDILPKLRQDGFEVVGQQEVPAIAAADQRMLNGLYSTGPSRKTARALVCDLRKGDRMSTVVMHWNAHESQDMVLWGYYLTVLDCTTRDHAREREGLLQGLAGTRYDQAYFAAYAQSEQQKADRSWAGHNARMRSNQAAFDAQQAAHRDMVNGVNDAQMGIYRTQSGAFDRGQGAWVDMMREEQNAVDPYTGEQFKIESGSQRYWMDQYGNYYGTDDVLNDPNHGNTTPHEWREVPTEP